MPSGTNAATDEEYKAWERVVNRLTAIIALMIVQEVKWHLGEKAWREAVKMAEGLRCPEKEITF